MDAEEMPGMDRYDWAVLLRLVKTYHPAELVEALQVALQSAGDDQAGQRSINSALMRLRDELVTHVRQW